MFIDQEVKGVNYDHDYFILESDSTCYLFLTLRGQQGQHWWFIWVCSSVYTFTFNKTEQLLWQLEVYRVCFKTCAWEFMYINLLPTDMRHWFCVLLICIFFVYQVAFCFINYEIKRKLAKETISLESVSLEP